MVHPMPQQINVSMCASSKQFVKSQKWQNTFYPRHHNLQVWKNVLIPNFFAQSRRLIDEGGPLFSLSGFLWAWSFVNGLQDLRACSGHTYFLQFLERVWPRQGGWPTREINSRTVYGDLNDRLLYVSITFLYFSFATFSSHFFVWLFILRFSFLENPCSLWKRYMDCILISFKHRGAVLLNRPQGGLTLRRRLWHTWSRSSSCEINGVWIKRCMSYESVLWQWTGGRFKVTVAPFPSEQKFRHLFSYMWLEGRSCCWFFVGR